LGGKVLAQEQAQEEVEVCSFSRQAYGEWRMCVEIVHEVSYCFVCVLVFRQTIAQESILIQDDSPNKIKSLLQMSESRRPGAHEKPLKVYTVSLGCPKNRVDSEKALASLGPAETAAESPRDADVVLINTCSFIAPAVEESLETIVGVAEELAELPKKPVLAVVGCLVNRYGGALEADLPEVDLFLRSDELHDLPRAVAEKTGQSLQGSGVLRSLSTGPGFAYLKINEGCDHACSFCTIPSIRGPLKSVPMDELLREAEFLAAQGVKEIVLVAQDVTAYGKDLGDKKALEKLLTGLLQVSGLRWVRLMYLYPAGLGEGFLSFLKEAGPPILPYFDVPVQHADPDVLSRMGRPFARDPRRVVERIRSVFPEASLRTSLITGFPGETEAAFKNLVDFVEEVRFDHLGVFAYCEEEGTPAAGLPGSVPKDLREERRSIIMDLQSAISAEKLEKHLGETIEVLVDAPQGEWPGLFLGRAWFQAPEVDGVVYISGEGVSPGRILTAEVVETHDFDLTALA
jgi:ribosomal protein S12 methylthiotransferase RimO